MGISNVSIGVLLAVITYMAVALMGACSRILSSEIPVCTILFFQHAICCALSFPFAWRCGLKMQHPGLYLCRTLSGAGSYLFLFIAVRTISLANAQLFMNTAPLWIPFIVWVWFLFRKDKRPPINRHLWWSIGLGFIGILLILRPGIGVFSIGLLPGIASGIVSAISLIAIWQLVQLESSSRIVFFYTLFTSLLSLPFAIFWWTSPTLSNIWLLISIGFLMAIIQLTITAAYRFTTVEVLAPMSYSSVLFGGLLDFLIWHQTPMWYTYIGMVCVVLGGIATLVLSHRHNQRSAGSKEA